MNNTISCPIMGLESTILDVLYVLHHQPSGKYGCYCHRGVNGLAVFTEEVGAVRFAEWIDLVGMTIDQVSFDEAREIAKGRPLPIVAMMLLDDMEEPEIHYVR